MDQKGQMPVFLYCVASCRETSLPDKSLFGNTGWDKLMLPLQEGQVPTMANDEKLLLKKYGNRRLYDTSKSAYVTLAEVADIIRKGTDVEVIDADTKTDVTAFILTQIILEQARKKDALLPPDLLHLIIRFGGSVLQEFFDKYLQHIITNYIEFKKVADEQFSKWIEVQLGYSNIARKTMADLASFKPFFDTFSKPPESKDKK